MNLHRALHHEWTNIPASQLNVWQRVAQRTSGIITVGNAVSLVGLSLVLYGLMLLASESYQWGIVLIVVGRLADLFDGFIANFTRTKSPVGEAVDASVDKLEAVAAITVLALSEIMPWYAAILLFAHSIFGGGIFLLARRRNGRVHPTREGKLATAVEWSLLASYVVAAIVDGFLKTVAIAATSVSLVAFTILGTVAAWQYAQAYRKLGGTRD